MDFKKYLFIALAGVALALTVSIFAQDTTPAGTAVQSAAPAVTQLCLHDEDGDGVCDLCGRAAGSGRLNSPRAQGGRGLRFGPGDGTGNQGSGPRDGTGFGRKSGFGDPSTCPGNRVGGRGHRGGRW